MASIHHGQKMGAGGPGQHNKKQKESFTFNQVSQKKRVGESPREKGKTKRAAFGDLTNAARNKFGDKKQKSLKTGIKKETVTKVPKSDHKNKNVESKCLHDSSASSEHSIARQQVLQLPPGVNDFDKENIDDIFQEPLYAMDIFNYYKQREVKFRIDRYLHYQPDLNELNRSILVDWMVEVQESFELNHETLYLAVKLVDLYLMKSRSSPISKSDLQLVGATAVFVACKFDERIPPLIDDFLYICEDAYTRKELICMEISMLKAVDFDLGIPLSYRFLRRYARVAKLSMDILTLARYILETSLMSYELIDYPDSQVGAAALLLALKMTENDDVQNCWTSTVQYYSGYEEKDLLQTANILNKLIKTPIHKKINVIKSKYSHKVFFEVAKIPTIDHL